MIKRNNLVYNTSSLNEYGGDKNINQPIQVVVKDVILISDYKLKIIYNNGATKNIELVNNSIKKFEYVSEGNKIIIETNNNDKFEIEIPIYWNLVDDLLRTKDGTKITLQDINEKNEIVIHKTGTLPDPELYKSGDTWLNEETLDLYTLYDDGVTKTWINTGAKNRTETLHRSTIDKNAETDFQHIDTTITKETLVEDDKVTIFDSITGKVVLTDKTNVGYRITDTISTTGVWSSSKTNEEINNLLPLIYAGL